jgi:hypothetical protein
MIPNGTDGKIGVGGMPVGLIGDSTTRVGSGSGTSSGAQAVTAADVAANVPINFKKSLRFMFDF